MDEFRNVMSDIVDDTLGDADPNDFVRFVLKSTGFGRPLNTAYQRRSQVNGEWLSELSGKLLQSHEELDLDNNLLLHVQHVALPLGNDAPLRKKMPVNMLLNLYLKKCVMTSVAQYDDIPCFGYVLALAIMNLTSNLNSIRDFALDKDNVIRLVETMFRKAGVPYGAIDVSQYDRFLCYLPANSRLIVVDAKEQGTALLYKSDICNVGVVNNVITPNIISLLLYNDHYYPLSSLSAWFGRSYYCIDCEKA